MNDSLFSIFFKVSITFLLLALFLYTITYKGKKIIFSNIVLLYIEKAPFNTDDHAKIRLAKYYGSYDQKNF